MSKALRSHRAAGRRPGPGTGPSPRDPERKRLSPYVSVLGRVLGPRALGFLGLWVSGYFVVRFWHFGIFWGFEERRLAMTSMTMTLQVLDAKALQECECMLLH